MSATIIKADVLALPKLAAKLVDVSDLAWVMILAVANEFDFEACDETENATRLARVYLAAHLASVSLRASAGAAGPITAQSAGQVRISYGLLAQAAGTNSWASTEYGQMLVALIGQSGAHGPILL